jgi:hypothetical protein
MQHTRLVLIATFLGATAACGPSPTTDDGGDAGGGDVAPPMDVPAVDVPFDVTQPAPNAMCSMPTTLVAGTPLTAQDTSQATTSLQGWCDPSAVGKALFYRLNVPAGMSALVTAQPAGSLDLVLRFITLCTASACERFDDHSDSTQPETGHWANRGTSAADIIIAVSPFSRTANGLFDLSASIVASETGITCETAPLVPSGTTLHGENLLLAETGSDPRCLTTANGLELFYRVTIPVAQRLTVTATPMGTTLNPVLRILDACTAVSCLASSDTAPAGAAETLTYTNISTASVDVIVSVGSDRETALGSYDVSFVTAP